MGGYTPTDIAQQALDAAGIDYVLGDIEDGTREAQVVLRAYEQCLKQLLRSANWDFARREAPLQLLADATGNTAGVGTLVPLGQFVYMYAYPVDCLKLRYIPWLLPLNTGAPTGNIVPPNATLPTMPGLNQGPAIPRRIRPARWVITNDPNYPPAGQNVWDVQGVSPVGRVVILTNVQNAVAVYTTLVSYPSVWDALFRAAFVAYLASEIALPLAKNKELGKIIRDDQIAVAKAKIMEARRVDGNEGTYSSDISVDWMRTRFSGGPGFPGWRGDGVGAYYGGWDECCGAGAVSAY